MPDHDPDQTASVVTDEELARSPDGVDQAWYLETYPDVAAAGADPVSHYLEFGWREGRDPRPDFSTTGYRVLNEEAVRAQENPLIHYLRHGGTKVSPHGSLRTEWHRLWTRALLFPRTGCAPPHATAPFGTPGRRKIVFTGHEATRTGAPLILLTLMQASVTLVDAELFLLLERDGPLLEEYRQVAHVLVNRNGAVLGQGGSSLRRLLETLARPGPGLAICNSAESWRLAQGLRNVDLPHILALVHERMTLYDGEACRILHGTADRVVFPSEAVRADAARALPRFRDAEVVSQGLLRPQFGRGDKNAARTEVRRKLGLPVEAKIVLGCGTRDLRKGFDLFVQLAARIRSQVAAPVHFVWLGGDGRPTELTKYVQHDMALLDLASRVSLVAETRDPERYFLAADVFALTSRDDPFPCVVHEAMACALPIVVFDGAGGAREAVADGCGIVVPYLDNEALARVVGSMLERPSDFAAMGEKAERRVRSVYRFPDYARRILEICNELQANASPS